MDAPFIRIGKNKDVCKLLSFIHRGSHVAEIIFRNEEATAIKETMNEFADTESERISIGKWLVDYASSKAELSILDVYHAQCEVDGVAQGRYDWRIERGERNMSL